jgi:hypothetical protein
MVGRPAVSRRVKRSLYWGFFCLDQKSAALTILITARCTQAHHLAPAILAAVHISVQMKFLVATGAELIDELFRLTTEWADAHPEEFERVAADDSDGLVSYIVHDSFDQVLETLERIKQDVTMVLHRDDHSSGELAFHASPHLLELVENAAKMLHVWGLEVEAAGEAIREAATAHTGRQIARPGDGSRPFFSSAADD